MRTALRHQAAACRNLGSPFNAGLCRLLADRLAPGTPLTDRLFAWEGTLGPSGASVPLRVAGALHGLVLDGTDPVLSAAYPPNEVSADVLWAAVERAFTVHAARIGAWLDQAPQTNEVGRSAPLIAAGHWLAERFGRPLVLSELGASAGLNLMWDRYGLRLGETIFGPASPALTVGPAWTGTLPPAAAPRVTGRRGVDLHPLDPQDPAARLRLLAYIWPDQAERLQRTRAALAVAEAQVDAGDAADWLATRLSEHWPGACHMLYHTVAWQYFPPETQTRARELIEKAGAQATDAAPLAWFSMEADGQPRGAGLRLRLWPGDLTFNMGRVDFHGRWVDWAPEQIT